MAVLESAAGSPPFYEKGTTQLNLSICEVLLKTSFLIVLGKKLSEESTSVN